jgi:hypothetical protein
MANTVSLLSYANTFGDWVVATNFLIQQNNNITANSYVKSSGTLYLNDSSLGLQVANGAVFAGTLQVQGAGSSAYVQNGLTVSGLGTFSNTTQSILTSGPITSNGQISASGANTGLYVANNATVNGTLTVSQNNNTTGNLTVFGGTTLTGATTLSSTLGVSGAATFAGTAYAQVFNASSSITAPTITATSLTVSGSPVLTTTNYNSYAPTLTGTGASGTWNINILGTASNQTNANYANTANSVLATNIVGNIPGNANNISAFTINQSVGTANNVQFSSLGVGTAASGTTGEIRATNNITAYYSDDRLKTRLGNIENALDKLMSLNGFKYEANETAQALGYSVKPEVGLSAQEVQAVLPEVVVPAPIDEKYLTIHYERVIPLLVEAIKELKAEIDTLKGGK